MSHREMPSNVSARYYDAGMSAAPVDPAPQYPRTQLGGEEAVIVPLARLSRLEAIERHAPAEVIAEAEAEEAGAGCEREARRQRARARWDEALASVTPEQRAKVARMVAHAEAQAAALPAPYNR
jgi:hypothetical protein